MELPSFEQLTLAQRIRVREMADQLWDCFAREVKWILPEDVSLDTTDIIDEVLKGESK